jgi:hypothetical protein
MRSPALVLSVVDVIRRTAPKRQVMTQTMAQAAVQSRRHALVAERFGGPGRDRTDDLFHAISEVYSKINNLGARTAILSDRKARNIPANWYHEWYHVLLFFLSPSTAR